LLELDPLWDCLEPVKDNR